MSFFKSSNLSQKILTLFMYLCWVCKRPSYLPWGWFNVLFGGYCFFLYLVFWYYSLLNKPDVRQIPPSLTPIQCTLIFPGARMTFFSPVCWSYLQEVLRLLILLSFFSWLPRKAHHSSGEDTTKASPTTPRSPSITSLKSLNSSGKAMKVKLSLPPLSHLSLLSRGKGGVQLL